MIYLDLIQTSLHFDTYNVLNHFDFHILLLLKFEFFNTQSK